jgi:hypothetical protein
MNKDIEVVADHKVYSNGPLCDPVCTSPEYHAIYARAFKAGEDNVAAKVRATLPAVPSGTIPTPRDVWGPTRKAWTRRGIKAATAFFGGYQR